MNDISKALSNFKLTKEKPIEHIINNFYKTFTFNDKVKHLSKAFLRHKFVLIVNNNDFYVCQSKDVTKMFLKRNKK